MRRDGLPVRRALISVSDKTGLAELGRGLAAAGVEIVSTGSTGDELAAAGVPVVAVADLTGFPECLDGRVKTLHPAVHAGLLADRRRPEHVAQLEDLGIAPYDLLICNLYPFSQAVAAGRPADEVVEQIDIGGPAMVRAAAKNYASIAVVVEPSRYADVLEAVHAGGFSLAARRALAADAFAHTAAYDVAVASWFAQELAAGPDWWPATAGRALRRAAVLRFGENPHQRAALYRDPADPAGLAGGEQLHGKEMSYNNYLDADAARRAAYDFAEPCVAIFKHANPCGIALGTDVAEAYAKAHASDPVSAYGGVVAVNRPVSVAMAAQLARVFTEVVVAPAYDGEALELLAAKPAIRLLRAPEPPAAATPIVEWRFISGGALAQTADRLDGAGDEPAGWDLRVGEPVDAATLADLGFAWRAARAVKSNAILLVAGQASVGIGMGQVNRVDAARLAVSRAGARASGAVAASDAYFPFPDGLQVLAEAGVRAVVEPGGSVRDESVISAAAAAGVTLYFTGVRHFAH